MSDSTLSYDIWTWMGLVVLAFPMSYLILYDRVWGTVASFLIILVWAQIDTARFKASDF